MIGKKIKYYRLKQGLTTEELAKALGCTKAAISQYENEEREPNVEICKKIAEVLNVDWSKLLSNDNNKLVFKHFSFRKKQSASKKDTDLLQLDIESQCTNHVAILTLLGLLDENGVNIKPLSFKDTPNYNANKIRKMMDVSLRGPFYSVTATLEQAGVIVLTFDTSDEIEGYNGYVNNIPYIFFNSKNRTQERQRFTIIHELCHLFFNNAQTDLSEKEIEKYINKVAGCVLIPDEDVLEIFGKKNNNITPFLRDIVSQDYKIAPSCLLSRLLDLGIITDSYYKNYFIMLNKKGGKKCEETLLGEDYGLEKPHVFTRQVYMALSKELITASKASEYLNVPLYDVYNNMRMRH